MSPLSSLGTSPPESSRRGPRAPAFALPLLALTLLLLSLVWVPGSALAAGTPPSSHPLAGISPSHASPLVDTRPSASQYLVTFDEVGLAAGTSWYVNVTEANGSVISYPSITSSVAFPAANGSYPYLIESPVPAGITIPILGPTEEFVANSTLGVVVVKGVAPAPVPVTYQEKFLLVMGATPTTGGTVFPGISYQDLNANVTIEALSSPGYVFSSWVGICVALPPTCAYTGSAYIAQITMIGPVVETATFVVKNYAVTFLGMGIPAGANWSVTFNGTTRSNPGPIVFSSPNGTFNYSISSPVYVPNVGRYLAANTSGRLTVDGSNVSMRVDFAAQFFLNVTVAVPSEGNLTRVNGWYPNGTSVTFTAIPSPGYAFTGWNGTRGSGISGTGSTLTVNMSREVTEVANFGLLYPVTVQESGLPTGTLWSLTAGGEQISGNSTQLTLDRVNGSYAFSLGLVPGYHPAPVQGSFHVAGSAATVNVTFHRVTYAVTFVGRGGGGGTWYLTLSGNNPQTSGPNSSVSLLLPNGTYGWSLRSPSGYQATQSSGQVVVNGENVSWLVTFNALPPTGLFGLGETTSYVIVGILAVAALVEAGLWARALTARYVSRRGNPPPPPSSEEEGGEEPAPEEATEVPGTKE